MNLVSIIVPMFNEENNVEECVNNLKYQTNSNFDVVFIDDGSTDNTIKNLKKHLSTNINFKYKIIKQSNSGAAEARRKGVDNSSTEYVMFFDCDDKISTDAVYDIYRIYREHKNVDIIIPELHVENESGGFDKFKFYTDDVFLNNLDCVNFSLNGWRVHGIITIRKKIVVLSYEYYDKYNPKKNNFINNDEVVTRFNFSNSKVIIRSKAIYYYCNNILSTTKKINMNRYLMIKNANIINDHYSDNDLVRINAYNELIAVIWGTHVYMLKNKSALKNVSDWKIFLKHSTNRLKYGNKFMKLSAKKKMQFILLKFLY